MTEKGPNESEVLMREYRFGDQSLSVYSRKYVEDTTKVSISMQVSVEQIWVRGAEGGGDERICRRP